MTRFSRVKWWAVSGTGKPFRSLCGEWFGVDRLSWVKHRNGWSSFVQTSDLNHALRQFKRQPVKHRQIDLRRLGHKPMCWAHGKAWRATA